MPFDPAALTVLDSTAAGFTLWHYWTEDTARDVLAPGYFNAAGRSMAAGDFMFLNAGLGTGSLDNGIVVVLGVGTVGGEPHVRVHAMIVLEA